jgi:hypothetical protein
MSDGLQCVDPCEFIDLFDFSFDFEELITVETVMESETGKFVLGCSDSACFD